NSFLFQTVITDQNQWDEMLQQSGIVVIDVYQAWCGPCKAMLNVFRKLRNEFSEDNVLHFAVAEADSIESLKSFRKSCEPVFLFSVHGKILAIVKGVNAPLLIKTVTELVQEERDIAAGAKERAEVLTNQMLKYKSHYFFPFSKVLTYAVGIIKPDDVLAGRVEEIIRKIEDAGFDIKAAEKRMLTEEQIREFYARNSEEPDFEGFVQFMMTGPCHVLIITKKEPSGAIPQWKELRKRSVSGEPEEPVNSNLNTVHLYICTYCTCFIRLPGLTETESLVNLCDVQDSVEDASRQLAFFFPNFDINAAEKDERTLAIIRPSLLKERRESIIQRIKDDGFQIAMQKEIILSEEQVRTFYKEHSLIFLLMILFPLYSGPTLILALTRENAVSHWRHLLGPKTLEEAKENPQSLRAQYSIQNVPINQLHGSSTFLDAQKELEFFFPEEKTFALIKPDAAKSHKDEIMKKVKEAGFSISRVKEQALTREMAAQFYKDHEGKPFFEDLVNFMTEGPSVIMVLSKENAVEEWRQLMGPTDPEEAKKTSPESIRAQFAHDILSNAVHGSSN
ncbi:TXND3 protein, partial [Pteruthius melanotis]|nr:TXND3 protein [Pteruthius melanotis]